MTSSSSIAERRAAEASALVGAMNGGLAICFAIFAVFKGRTETAINSAAFAGVQLLLVAVSLGVYLSLMPESMGVGPGRRGASATASSAGSRWVAWTLAVTLCLAAALPAPWAVRQLRSPEHAPALVLPPAPPRPTDAWETATVEPPPEVWVLDGWVAVGPLPSGPLEGQSTPPCDSQGLEVNGACWLVLDDKPTRADSCGGDSYAYHGLCLLPWWE